MCVCTCHKKNDTREIVCEEFGNVGDKRRLRGRLEIVSHTIIVHSPFLTTEKNLYHKNRKQVVA